MARSPRRNRSEENRKVDEVKTELCEILRGIALAEHWTQREMAMRLGTTEACVSYVVRYRTHRLSVGQLFTYLAVLRPNFRILVAHY